MDHSIIDKEKIEKINKGLWTVNRFEFFVEIENDNYTRIFNKNELAAIQTQIIVSNLVKNKEKGDEEEEKEEKAEEEEADEEEAEEEEAEEEEAEEEDAEEEEAEEEEAEEEEAEKKANDKDDENNVYEVFNDHFKKMMKYREVVEYLNFIGIAKFESITRKEFAFFEEVFNEKWLYFKNIKKMIYEDRPKIEFLTDSIQHSAFRVIGEIIQSNKDNDAIPKLESYMKCVLGTGIPTDTFRDFIKEFMEKQNFDVLFDSFKLGQSFCQYFSQKKVNNQSIFRTDEDKNILDSFSNSYFLKKIQASERNNITFIKVTRPSHCYHCILSITRTITNFSQKIFYLNEKTLIFCNNVGNFIDRIKDIPRTSVKDTEKKDSDLVYFIVHPEMLNEKDHSFLVEFLDARLNFYLDKKLPKVFVISSLNYRIFCYKHVNKFKDIEIQISKDIIEKLCKLSHPDRPEVDYCFQLYYSENAGSGKTYQIIQDFTNDKNCIKSDDHVLKSIFVDLSMKKLPKLLNEKNQTYNYVHLDLSPELFDNNYEFFDNLWTLAILGYQINADGSCTIPPKNIFFEVPTLTKKQFPDGGFISEADFPIYCNHYHRISAKKTSEEVETSSQIKIPDNVKKFCDEIFTEKNIENTSELLLIATKMFYPKITFNESYFVPRILEEINVLMEEFCKDLPIEDEYSKAIFLLLLRTNFHIWNMESLFAGINKDQPKTFIILSNQNLFSSSRNKNKWILLCFNSIGEENEWNTKCLKNDIGEVNESAFFQNKFFQQLLNNPNIEIYSNQINYENDQAYFFNIIRKFFYFNNNINGDYRKITDGVILNDVKNNESYDIIKDVLPGISQGKDIYEQSQENIRIHKWTSVFDSLYSIFKDYGTDELELVSKLSTDERVQEICNVKLTMTLVKRFVVMIIRIILKQPLIFEGFTGVGKTWSVKLLKLLVEIAENKDDFNWAYHQIDCHGALQIDELLEIRKKELSIKQSSKNHIFFFDELNTSSVSNYVINEMNNYYLKQKNIPKEKTSKNEYELPSIVFIAAINPYMKVDKFSRSSSLVGINQIIPSKTSKLKLCNITPNDNKNLYEVTDINKLAYNVRELSDSTKMIILKSDPELFFFDKEDENKKSECSEYLPTDEIKTIGHIIDSFLNKLIQQIKNGQYSNLKNVNISLNEKTQTTIFDFLEDNKKAINNIILSLLCKSFLEIRELMRLKSILSFRDVKRTMLFFILFFTKLIKVYIRNNESENIPNDILVEKIVPQTIVLTIMISIVYRFSNETRIETADGNISNSNEEEEKILARCAKFGLNLTFSEDRTYFKVNIRSVLLKKLMKINWTRPFTKPADWNKVVQSYAWLKCMKYIYSQEINKSTLFKLKSLMTHLFAISSCYSACRNNKDSVIPCLIIGMPGTSKTLAIQLFTDYKQKKNEKKDGDNSEATKKFFSTTYLSTRVSEAEGLNAHYRDCAMFMLDNKDSFAVCVIDELGLANLNETRPLKLLHYYFDKGIRMETDKEYKDVPVMSIAASNYALDYANMNRGILICTDLPTDSDIAEAFYFSELESDNIKDIDIAEYKKNYFNDDYNFFEWQNSNNYTKYSKYLQTLWELTDNKERPDMLTLRPLYLLFNSIFHNTQNLKDDEFIDNLCLYIISAISCSPSVSFEKVKSLLNILNEKITDDESIKLIKRIVDDQKTNIFKAFKEIFNGPENNKFFLRFCDIIDEKIHKKQNKKKSIKKLKKKKKTKTKTKRKVKASTNDNDIDNNDNDNDNDGDNNNDIKNLAEFITINDKIKSEAPFNSLREIINKDDEDDVYHKALKAISANTELFADLTKEINDTSYDNYKILRQFIKPSGSEISKRALCFRTKNYECLDFIEELIIKTSNHLGEERTIEFMYIYPSDFKLSKQISADKSIKFIIDKINNYKNSTLYYLLIIGNVCITDALLDLLNTPNQGKGGLKTKKPLISKNGFSVELEEYPKNIMFCFVMNEKDFHNRNSADSFPVPLLDRLNQLYLDYNQKDEFGIIEKYKKYYDENRGLSTPYSQIIHDYFKCFVSNLKNVPEPVEENHYAVVYSTTDIDESFFNKIQHNKYRLSQNYNDIKWDKKIILLQYYRRTGNINACNELINELKNDKDHIFTFYWSNEYDKLYAVKEKFDGEFEIPLPKPKNYDLLENDGSINKLISTLGNKEESKQKVDRAIIVTTSPLMEDLKLNSSLGFTTQNTLILYDQYISSGDDFEERIKKNKKKNIIIRLNNFQIEHDRYLRYLLGKQQNKSYTIIIYHIKNSIMPEGLYASLDWPVYWIESITNSPLSEFPTTEIVEIIRFRSVYKLKAKDIYIRILKQIYHDIDNSFENHIDDSNKVDEILNYIFIKLNQKYSDESFIDMVDFSNITDKFEGKIVRNSFRNLDFKREFYNSIINQIPFLENFIHILILNRDTINIRNIEDTKQFISNIFEYDDVEKLLERADIDNINYRQYNNGNLYFPELVFPEVIKIYEVYNEGKDNFPEIDKQIFKIFCELQVGEQNLEVILQNYCNHYFQSYLSFSHVTTDNKYSSFVKKIKELFGFSSEKT